MKTMTIFLILSFFLLVFCDSRNTKIKTINTVYSPAENDSSAGLNHSALNRDPISLVLKENDSKPDTININRPSSLNELYDHLKKPFQVIIINGSIDTVLTLKEGTKLKIPAYAFVLEKERTPVKGPVEVSVREYYKISDMIMSGLTTQCGQDLLETGGMIFIEIKSNGWLCSVSPGKNFTIGFPYTVKKEGMRIFERNKNDEEKITWQETTCSDQEVNEAPKEIFTVVEEQPQYPGGDLARVNFLQSNLVYPEAAKELGVRGKVFITFVVETNGSITNVKVIRGLGAGCDEEAVRLIKAMPGWIPGSQRGVPVRVQFNLPVEFRLDEEKIKSRISNYQDTTGSIKQSKELKEQLENMNYYYLTSRSTGWINCDRYTGRNQGPTDYSLDVMKTDSVDVIMVFHDLKSIVSPKLKLKNKILFTNVPGNLPITIIGIKVSLKKVFLSMHDDKTSPQNVQWLNLKEISEEELKRALQKLDK
jgi:TonB family protein